MATRIKMSPNRLGMVIVLGVLFGAISAICEAASFRSNNNNSNKKHGKVGNTEKFLPDMAAMAAADVAMDVEGFTAFASPTVVVDFLHEDHVIVNLAFNKSI